MSLYRDIRDQIQAIFDPAIASSHPGVPIFWRSNDAEVLPDPTDTQHFLRMEIHFDRERLVAFGGGLGKNLREQYGCVDIYSFTSRQLQNEDAGLDLLSDAVGIFRSQRIGDLSFIGSTSGPEDVTAIEEPTENGNWFMRGQSVVYLYRFIG